MNTLLEKELADIRQAQRTTQALHSCHCLICINIKAAVGDVMDTKPTSVRTALTNPAYDFSWMLNQEEQ